MAMNKKDDEDAGIVKVDRTSVFQEGKELPSFPMPFQPARARRTFRPLHQE